MDKLNIPFFYQLGYQLNPLTKMEVNPQNRVNIWVTTLALRNSINSLLGWGGRLTVCHNSATSLIKAMDEVQKWISSTKPEDMAKADSAVDWKFQQLIDKVKTFETVLSEELFQIPAYCASQKCNYLISGLIDSAEKVFPPAVLTRLSQSIIKEVQQAGKCLVFDNSTASGFHMLRATEEVLHEYYLAVCEPKSVKKLRSWAAYINVLFKLTKDTATDSSLRDHVNMVSALLRQIKDQDRNLIMHPEVTLDDNEALRLFEITKSVIMAMADKLPVPKLPVPTK